MNEVAPVENGKAVAKPELRAGGTMGAIVPQDAEQAYRMAQLIAKSGIAPRDMQTPEKIVTAIFHGLEVGLKPLQAIQSIAVVNGRPCIWGDAALGLAMGSGLLEDIAESIEGEGDAMRAVCVAKRVGNTTPVARSFSVADARKANLWGKTGPWSQYPQRMLQMRARSWALRDGFADVLKGLHVVEEVRDYRVVSVDQEGREALTGQDIIEQAKLPEPEPEAPAEPEADPAPPAEPEAPPAAEPPAEDVKEEKVSESQRNAEPPAEREPDDIDLSAFAIPIVKQPNSDRTDWIAFYTAARRKAAELGPHGIGMLREANDAALTEMAQKSRQNYKSLMAELERIEGEG